MIDGAASTFRSASADRWRWGVPPSPPIHHHGWAIPSHERNGVGRVVQEVWEALGLLAGCIGAAVVLATWWPLLLTGPLGGMLRRVPEC